MHASKHTRNLKAEDSLNPFRPARTPGRILGLALLWVAASLSLVAQSPAAPVKSINELRAFFQQRCVRCHGLDGSAKDPEGKKLGGLDFTKAAQEFRELAGPASEREIRKMVKTIRKGIFFGRIMPSWKEHLSLEDADVLVREILLKAERGKAIEPDPEAVKPS